MLKLEGFKPACGRTSPFPKHFKLQGSVLTQGVCGLIMGVLAFDWSRDEGHPASHPALRTQPLRSLSYCLTPELSVGPTCVGEMLRNGLEESKCCVELASTLVRTCCQSGKCLHDGLLRPSQPHQNKGKTECQLILVSGATMNS